MKRALAVILQVLLLPLACPRGSGESSGAVMAGTKIAKVHTTGRSERSVYFVASL